MTTSVFDAVAAFRPLHGITCANLRELQRVLGELRWRHLATLPLSFGVDDLMHLARGNGWLTERDDGSFVFRVEGA